MQRLGGYCEMCGRWVWVNARGECQFGHPASAVREVQPLKPRDDDDRPAAGPTRPGGAPGGAPGSSLGTGHGSNSGTGAGASPGSLVPAGENAPVPQSAPPKGDRTRSRSSPPTGTAYPLPRDRGESPTPFLGAFPPLRRGDYRWWWRHSLWIPLTFTAGFFNWVAFLYIGVRARRVAWLLASLAYLIPIALTIAAIGTPYLAAAIGFQLFVAGASVLHAFVARPLYRAIMFGDPPKGIGPAPPPVLPTSSRPALPRGLDAEVAAVIREAETQVDEIAAAAEWIEKPEVRHKVSLLCRTAEEILSELRKDPRQVPLARPFLSYYLEAAHRIVRGYADLDRRRLDSPDSRDTMARAEASLDSIQRAFDGQLAALLQHQVLDLDSEIALLEKTVRLDSLMAELPEDGPADPDNDPATAETGGPR